MKRKKMIQIFAIAFAIIVTLVFSWAATYGQNSPDAKKTALISDDQGFDLVGVWEAVGVPSENDCTSGEPAGPIVNVTYTFNQGGTMYAEDTLSIDRFRTTGSGIWKRTGGRNYTYRFFHYAFYPDGTFFATVKGRSNLALSRDGNSLSERGTFQLLGADGTTVLYAGCFNGTSRRITF